MADYVKDFDTIMQEIAGGLTGDAKADISYLTEKMKEFKGHEMGQEIVRACGRLMYDLLPEDAKKEMSQAIDNDAAGIQAALEEVKFNIYKKEYDKALSLIEPLVKKADEYPMFQDDRLSEYRIFDELYEELLYRFIYEPEKTLRRAEFPFTEIYSLYGSLLVEMKRFDEARTALKKGLRWNPMHFTITSEYIETYKMTGDLDEFYRLTMDAFKIAIHPAQLARCYRNIGYYFIEKELYYEAQACYLLSLRYDPESKQAQSELYVLNRVTEGKMPDTSVEEIQGICDKYGFPFGGDDDVIGLAYTYGKHFMEQDEIEAAIYCFKIVYELTNDESVKKIIDRLEAGENWEGDNSLETGDVASEADEPEETEKRSIEIGCREKDYTASVTIRKLPANEKQLEAILGFPAYVKERQDILMTVRIEDEEFKDDVPQAVSIADSPYGYYMELEYNMDEWNWDHPLLLANDHLTEEEAISILETIFRDCSDDNPIVTNCFGEISSSIYPEEEE